MKSKLPIVPRGGFRPNAKRPRSIPDDTKPWTVRVTPSEKAKLKALLEELRKPL